MMLFQRDTLSLNNPEPSALEMGQIYEPPPVPFTFETIGWAILGAVLMLGILVLVFFLLKKYVHNRYRREALAALTKIGDDQNSFPQVFIILKRVAIEVFGREKVGPLFGSSWLSFLDKTGKEVSFLKYQKQIETLIYHDQVPEEATRRDILSQAQKWIKTHAS